MADASTSLKGLREQMVAAAQAIAEERRSHSGNSPIPSTGNVKCGTKPVIDGSTLRTDDRQRLARERREEREKQNAAKESQMIEKEKKAKLQYERQMEERQRKMEEQKLKEEQRRAAVEEKRKLKTEEEKERNEAVLRRTLERSQRMEQRQKRWSWGGAVPSDSDSQTSAKRSTSSCSLKQAETVIHKRLSSSSATLPNSTDKSVKTRSSSLNRLSNKAVPHSVQPSTSIKGSQTEIKGGTDSKRSSSLNRLAYKPQFPLQLENEKMKNEDKSGARRSQTSPLESNILSRLLAPTQASLARSKNAAALSGDGKDPTDCHLCPRSASANTTVHTPKGPMRSRSIDRSPIPSTTAYSAEAGSPESTQKPEIGRQSPSIIKKRPPSPSNIANRRRSPSPANLANRPPSPSTLKSQNQKNRPPSPSLLKQRPFSAPSKPASIPRPSLTPSVSNITKKKSDLENKPKDKIEEPLTPELLSPTSEKEISVGASKAKEDMSGKITSGTITAEEAAKTLAEKRRHAREQRERDEQEKLQRAEEERIKKEELDKKAAEENMRIEEECQKLQEQRQAEEAAALMLAEEEKIRKDLEELKRVAELQQQKEEADAKALEEAEKQKFEREKIMQQNMQERLERKKRIEEIMKRTRKIDQSDGKFDGRSDDQELDDEDFLQHEFSQQGENNAIELSQEITRINENNSEKSSLLASTEPVFQDTVEPEHIFINGGEQSCDKENQEISFETVKPKDSSVPSKENVQNSDVLQMNKDETIDSLQNMNGKSTSWTFEEFIDLGINSKSTKLASNSRTASTCNQNMIDGAFIPTTPKVAFEEVGAVDILTKSIEAASAEI